MPIKLQRLSEFGRRPVINNAKYFETDWMPNEQDYYTCQAGDIVMYNHPKFEGGGTAIGRICKEVVEQLYPGRKFNNLMEWASGPSYIGFLFLGTGMCDQLTCADIYRPALRAVEKTIENLPEKYAGKVDWFHILGVADIPEHKKFDLIIGSPPHWDMNDHPFVNQVLYNDRRSADPDWLVHREFFANIKKNLTKDGVILLQEQAYACGPRTFEKYINEAGLRIKEVYWEGEDMQNNLHCYYLEIVHAE
jgi:hypothetical protein